MVWPNGERLRRWRERKEIKKESERIIKARREIPELELKLARKKELTKVIGEQKALEREIAETERQREIARLRREAVELRELAEIRKVGREIAEARRVLKPQYGGVGRITGVLGQLGVAGQRMLRTAPTQPVTPVPRPLIGIGSVPSVKVRPLKYQAPRRIIPSGKIPARPLISFWPQAQQKKKRR